MSLFSDSWVEKAKKQPLLFGWLLDDDEYFGANDSSNAFFGTDVVETEEKKDDNENDIKMDDKKPTEEQIKQVQKESKAVAKITKELKARGTLSDLRIISGGKYNAMSAQNRPTTAQVLDWLENKMGWGTKYREELNILKKNGTWQYMVEQKYFGTG